jgi:hypothetical protein
MWEPRPLATLGASTACNRDILTFTFYIIMKGLVMLNVQLGWRKQGIHAEISMGNPEIT